MTAKDVDTRTAPITRLPNMLAKMLLMLNAAANQMSDLKRDNIRRSCILDARYISTVSFDLEAPDKEWAFNQGRRQAAHWLEAKKEERRIAALGTMKPIPQVCFPCTPSTPPATFPPYPPPYPTPPLPSPTPP